MKPQEPISDVLFDTQVVIYGVRGHPNPTDDAEINVAKKLLDGIAETSCESHISTISISESLVRIENYQQKVQFVQVLRNSFTFQDFDLPTAFRTAEIIQEMHPVMKKLIDKLLASGQDGARKIVHSDMKIIGTAVLNEISTICTNDKQIHKLAKPYIKRVLYPTQLYELLVKQPELFAKQ